jgi:hypothetical protein
MVQFNVMLADIDVASAITESSWHHLGLSRGYRGYIGKILVIDRILLAIMVAYWQQYGTILTLSWECIILV